jgi:hypothetical protein
VGITVDDTKTGVSNWDRDWGELLLPAFLNFVPGLETVVAVGVRSSVLNGSATEIAPPLSLSFHGVLVEDPSVGILRGKFLGSEARCTLGHRENELFVVRDLDTRLDIG